MAAKLLSKLIVEKNNTTIEIHWLEPTYNPDYGKKAYTLHTTHFAEVELKQAVSILRQEGFVVHIKQYDYDEEDEFQLSDVKGRLCDLDPEVVEKMTEEEKEETNFFYLIVDAFASKGRCKALNSLLCEWNGRIPDE